jgi:galactose-1-phosphate uridylyltransferase
VPRRVPCCLSGFRAAVRAYGEAVSDDPPLRRLPDGTVKQVSPLTGTQVWTVPRRAHRPQHGRAIDARPLDPALAGRHCAFCPDRYLETPPEKARLVAEAADGGGRGAARHTVLRHLPAARLGDTVAELRRVPNLFEILSVDYWRADHGWTVPDEVRDRAAAYVADPPGRAHVLEILRRRAAAEGVTDDAWAARGEEDRLVRAVDLFAGSHDVVVARRHHVDGATHEDQLAGAGTLTPAEHHRFVAFTVATVRDLYVQQPHAAYVAAFQNWLRPAGASFDHLHKQVIAIDEPGPRLAGILAGLRHDPDVVRRQVLRHAEEHGLVVARTDHAVALAGVGHTYPALEVWSLDADRLPWEHDEAQVRDLSDLLHAVHAATGVAMPTNEEWHHRPPSATERLPWHVVLKWRDATAAGFEGATGIHVTTVAPRVLRDTAVARLRDLREAGAVAPVGLGDE